MEPTRSLQPLLSLTGGKNWMPYSHTNSNMGISVPNGRNMYTYTNRSFSQAGMTASILFVILGT